MKKILFSLCACLVLGFYANTARAVEGELFASNTVLSPANLTLTATDMRAQTFTATADHLTGFYAYLNDRVNGSTVVAYLINESSGEVIEQSSQRMGSGNGWEEFNFNSPLLKQSVYRVKILVPTATGVKWVRSGDVYSGGWYYFGSGPSDYDMNSDLVFQAWGYNNPAVPETQTAEATSAPVLSSATPAGGLVASAETPSVNTTNSITKPTNLKAVYDQAVNLQWKESATSAIDGYKIFRSESKGGAYGLIGQTAKVTTSYQDKTVLGGKSYYYVVRAYKGSDQSGSSNEASVTVPAADASVSAVEDEAGIVEDSDGYSSNNNYLLWALGIVALTMSLVLLLIIKRRQDRAKTSGLTSPVTRKQ